MTTPLRVLSRGRRNAALIVGAVFLLGAAVPLAVYLASFGIDWLSGYALVLVVLAAVMLVAGAPSTPRRWGVVRITVGLLCLSSYFVFQILTIQAIGSANSPDASGLLIVTGLALLPVAPCVGIVGRPGRNPSETRAAEANRAGWNHQR
jgi:peptidoglycan/LPS O-acetylase OafA/YrhL